ncbi:MAG: hypothetical protein QI223_07405, partial [Candidatus Korarchaeota archaeon]|nr:hypothetical protein [Candidatus Korarchaeota archaeon]
MDYSVLRVPLPLRMKRPRSEVEEMLEPLARLCEQYKGRFPAGEWKYEWYYLELLDRDGECQPLCWVDVGLLAKYFVDAEEPAAGTDQPMGLRRYSRRMSAMDSIAAIPATSDGKRHQRDKWREWFVRTWRENESSWLRAGLVVYQPVRPWSQMLEFRPERVEVDAQRQWAWDWSADVRQQWRLAYAGHPGLYWRMIPLYDQRDVGRIWNAMKRELYMTSVFSLSGRERQDPELWKRLQQRFALPFQRMTRYRYYVRLREQYVLE